MPSIEVSDQLYARLMALAEAGMRFEAPPSKGCTHWSIYTGEQQFACICQPERLRTIFSTVEQLSAALSDNHPASEVNADPAAQANEGQAKPATPAAPRPAGKPIPTPAQVVSHPLTYTPPAFVKQPRTQFLPAAQGWLAESGLDEKHILDIISNPDEVVPAAEWRTIYRRDGLDVVFAEKDFLVLAVKPSSEAEAEGTGLQRLPGQKEKRRLPVPPDVDGMIALMESRGFEVEHGGKHWKVTHPDFEAVASMPHTPSDYRWAQNMVTEIRSKFGIDLREKQD